MGKSQPTYTKEFKQQAVTLFAHKWKDKNTNIQRSSSSVSDSSHVPGPRSLRKMDTTIGVKEAKVRENKMMNFLRSVLKMRIITIGVITEVLAFMQT